MIEYNYLELIDKRELTWIPPQFVKTVLPKNTWNKFQIIKWIRGNLSGRFVVTNIPNINNNDVLESPLVVAFEDHAEMTFFLLACQYLRSN